MVKISAVCGMGLGSGLLIKMGIDKVLEKNGYKPLDDFSVEVADISTARATFPDIFVTTSEFAERLGDVDAEIVTVKNLFDKKEIEEKLIDTFIKVYKKRSNS
ncbi:MAG: PTS sugar transporter subunit IIB [Anaerolineaceae bacterium]|nr:PTS sugar transporter subunit IIB [Anaerolineaceae bacterium]